jgi:hypothetical protein
MTDTNFTSQGRTLERQIFAAGPVIAADGGDVSTSQSVHLIIPATHTSVGRLHIEDIKFQYKNYPQDCGTMQFSIRKKKLNLEGTIPFAASSSEYNEVPPDGT